MIRFLLALLLLATPASAGMVIGSGAADYSDIILWEDFVTDDGNITTSNCNTGTDTTWALNSAAAIDATAKLSGNYGLDSKGPDDYASLSVTGGDYIDGTKGALVFMIKTVTSAVGAPFVRAASTTDSRDYFYLRFHGADSGNLQFVWVIDDAAESSCNTDGAGLADGGQYYIVLTWDSDANTLGLYIYDSTGAPLDSCTSASAMTPIVFDGTIRLGEYSGLSTVLYLDKLIIFDGSIARTAADYLAICKDVASCPL